MRLSGDVEGREGGKKEERFDFLTAFLFYFLRGGSLVVT